MALRTSITYTLSHTYGTFSHTQAANFRSNFRHNQWLARVEQDAASSQEDFIRHYRNKYQGFPRLPIWMATEVITLGALSRLYEGMLKLDQDAVASDYNIQPAVLRTWLRTLTYIRNLCAHHARLWNRQLSVAPEMPRHDVRWQAPLTPTNRRLFAVLLILRQMMHHHHQGLHWQQCVTQLLEPISEKAYWRTAMGLPDDWQAHPLWNRVVQE
ncbi:MAG: Abi family protein [Methylococcales bacterium]